MEIAGDRSRSIGARQFVTVIFSFRTVKERQRLVEMVRQETFAVLRGVQTTRSCVTAFLHVKVDTGLFACGSKLGRLGLKLTSYLC